VRPEKETISDEHKQSGKVGRGPRSERKGGGRQQLHSGRIMAKAEKRRPVLRSEEGAEKKKTKPSRGGN